MRNATPPALSSAAALLDGLFEHPEAIQFPTPCGKRNLILRMHRAYPQPAEVWELCFITWEGRKLQEGGKRVAWSSSCSRNAHDRNVLVRRAQSRINQATLENELGDWDDARSGDHLNGLARRVAIAGVVKYLSSFEVPLLGELTPSAERRSLSLALEPAASPMHRPI